jgi:hypothetical protein
MSLVTWEDLQKPAPSDPRRAVRELSRERLDDSVRPMPPPPAMLGADERNALDDWLDAGAPPYPNGCMVSAVPPLQIEAPPCASPEVYRAHGLATDQSFQIPVSPENGGDLTVCFSFTRPSGPQALAVGWAPVIDTGEIVHHINLYAVASPDPESGGVPCRIDRATYLMGWEPGRPNTVLPADIGLELPSDGASGLMLEVHYHHASTGQTDRSGMAFCTTAEPRRLVAAMLTAGTDQIAVPALARHGAATGHCPASVTSELSEPLHVLSSAPHMHQLGTSLTTQIVHADGTVDVAAPPDPWDPHRQPLYLHQPPLEIRPGDELFTTCLYANPTDHPVRFGPRATDEMCYSYNLVYPVSALPPRLNQAPLRLCDCPDGVPCDLLSTITPP